jgi:hypothetical protein
VNPDYGGMTINERLFEAGLLEQFYRAAKSRNRETMIEILTKVSLLPEDAVWTADKMLKKPRVYGL